MSRQRRSKVLEIPKADGLKDQSTGLMAGQRAPDSRILPRTEVAPMAFSKPRTGSRRLVRSQGPVGRNGMASNRGNGVRAARPSSAIGEERDRPFTITSGPPRPGRLGPRHAATWPARWWSAGRPFPRAEGANGPVSIGDSGRTPGPASRPGFARPAVAPTTGAAADGRS